MTTLLQKKKWSGCFFSAEKGSEEMFSGEVSYSPENGVVLDYLLLEELKEEEKFWPIYGVLSTGELCTLVGLHQHFVTGGLPQIKDGFASHPGSAHFSCLFIGAHIDEKMLINKINFSLTNLQEFFFPEGRKDFIRYLEKPLFEVETKYGNIEVGNSATFNSIYLEKASSLFYNRNKQALDELQNCLVKINEKYSDSSFMLKKSISYQLRIKLSTGEKAGFIYKYISELSDLFSILLHCPIFPDEIKVRLEENDGYNLPIKMYPSMMLSKRVIEQSTKKRSHYHMPITRSNIDLASTIGKWLGISENYSTLVSSIQNETGYTNLHSIYGEFILYATQLEMIAHTESPKNKEKYLYPIKKYTSKEVIKNIYILLAKIGEKDIGVFISSLRGELAHVGRPRKLLKKLSLNEITKLCQYMQMTVLGFTLTELGVEEEVIFEYQNKFTPNA